MCSKSDITGSRPGPLETENRLLFISISLSPVWVMDSKAAKSQSINAHLKLTDTALS